MIYFWVRIFKYDYGRNVWNKIQIIQLLSVIEIGLIYLLVLYKYPMQALPVLALVSKERQTGKSTYVV